MLYVVDGLQFLLITLTDLLGRQIAEGIVISIIMIVGLLLMLAMPLVAWQIVKAVYLAFNGVTIREIIHGAWSDTKEAALGLFAMLAFPLFLYIQFAGPILLVCWIATSFGWSGPILAAILVAAMIYFCLSSLDHSQDGLLLNIWVASFVVFTVVINVLGAYLMILIIPFYVLKYASQTICYMFRKRHH